ncbi:hypothetical protein [Roseibium suaedae]|uniref:Uncharacterized protein n=1 Tax=Roseibium suaedae TaxID=735517 RepID=A0A1M7L5L7_9HYPH|nr:hypothetical protein [Roseibium suaedae]SHM73126.1 hypothetical protein SAMN05444272_3077 [Roseibium suaedae]
MSRQSRDNEPENIDSDEGEEGRGAASVTSLKPLSDKSGKTRRRRIVSDNKEVAFENNFDEHSPDLAPAYEELLHVEKLPNGCAVGYFKGRWYFYSRKNKCLGNRKYYEDALEAAFSVSVPEIEDEIEEYSPSRPGF